MKHTMCISKASMPKQGSTTDDAKLAANISGVVSGIGLLVWPVVDLSLSKTAYNKANEAYPSS